MPAQYIDTNINEARGEVAVAVDGETHEMTHECALTTVDNPYDPFTEWNEWFAWDFNAKYHSPSLLARLLITSSDLSEADQRLDLENVVNKIVIENWYGVHRKLLRPLTG